MVVPTPGLNRSFDHHTDVAMPPFPPSTEANSPVNFDYTTYPLTYKTTNKNMMRERTTTDFVDYFLFCIRSFLCHAIRRQKCT